MTNIGGSKGGPTTNGVTDPTTTTMPSIPSGTGLGLNASGGQSAPNQSRRRGGSYSRGRGGRGGGRGGRGGRGGYFRGGPPIMYRRISYATYLHMGDNIKKRTKYRPKIGLICGSGLSGMADQLENPDVIPFRSIRAFPRTTVEGHTGELVLGTIGGVEVAVMKGRFHPYEGYPLWRMVAPVRLLAILGITHLVITNTSGGLNPNYKIGDIVLIKDHIDMMALCNQSPLTGDNISEFGPRFPALNRAYSHDLLSKAKSILIKHLDNDDSSVKEGVYCGVGGPSYGTIAEARLLRQLGADVKGMSTVGEVVTAVHAGMNVLGMSLVSAMSPMEYNSEVNVCHEEVLAVTERKKELLRRFFCDFVLELKPELMVVTKEEAPEATPIVDHGKENNNDISKTNPKQDNTTEVVTTAGGTVANELDRK